MNLRYNHDENCIENLKSRNFEKLQRFSASSRNSEKIRQNFIKISEIATKFEKNANVLAFVMLQTPPKLTKFAEILRSERCKSMQIL